MDREKAYLVALPFKKRNRSTLKISDFIFAISFDLKWGPPDKARALLLEAESEGLVHLDGETVNALFEMESVEIPVGFKPAPSESILDRGIRLICSSTGLSRKDVIAMVNERQDSLQRLVNLDAVVLVVAREMGLDVSDLATEAYESLIHETTNATAD